MKVTPVLSPESCQLFLTDKFNNFPGYLTFNLLNSPTIMVQDKQFLPISYWRLRFRYILLNCLKFIKLITLNISILAR